MSNAMIKTPSIHTIEVADKIRVQAPPKSCARTALSFLHSPKFHRRDDFSRITDIEIYYGTMFGSAEQFARSLAHEITAHRSMRVTVHDLDGFDVSSFVGERLNPTRLFVFVLSTHFAGSPSPSAERFHRWISHLMPTSNTSKENALNPPESPSAACPRVDRGTILEWFRARPRLPFTRRIDHLPLIGMHYAVFGIGDSMYLTYNAMAKYVDTRLKELGATRLLPVGLGDCSNNVKESYKAWEASLLHRLPRRVSFSLLHDIRVASTTAVRRLTRLSIVTPSVDKTPSGPSGVGGYYPSTCDLHQIGGVSALTVRDNFGQLIHLRFQCVNLREAGDTAHAMPPASARSPTPTWSSSFSSRPRTPRVALFDDKPFAEIEPIERVGDGRSSYCRTSTQSMQRSSGIFRVKLLNPDVTYTTVSTLAIFPRNDPTHVEAIAEAFQYDLDAEIELFVDGVAHTSQAELRTEQQQLPFPTPCTIRTALTEFLEIRTVTPEFIRVASGFVVSLDDKVVLESLSSSDGSTAFRTQIQDQHKGILDIIAMAPTLQIPWAVFVNIAQPIKPRYFTIASSPKVSPRDLDLAIAFGGPSQPQGLATSFFERILSSQHTTPVPLRGFISVSRFKIRDDGVSPMVFIASGVGFAAMRAIIQDRLMQWAQNMTNSVPGRTHSGSMVAIPKQLLFLGATNETSIVFLKDLRRWEQQMIVQVHHAFSNDYRHPSRYVQDIVASRIDEIVQTVKSSPGARIFVCGRVAMVRRIREIFEADQRRRGTAWFSAMHKSGRFIEEGYY